MGQSYQFYLNNIQTSPDGMDKAGATKQLTDTLNDTIKTVLPDYVKEIAGKGDNFDSEAAYDKVVSEHEKEMRNLDDITKDITRKSFDAGEDQWGQGAKKDLEAIGSFIGNKLSDASDWLVQQNYEHQLVALQLPIFGRYCLVH